MLRRSLFDSWSFFKNHVIALSLIIIPIVAPIEVFTSLYENAFVGEEAKHSRQVLPLLIYFIAHPIYAAGVVFYIASVISDNRIDTLTSWRQAAANWLPYVVMSLLIGVAVMLGFFVFIIPGIILAIRFAFSEFDLLLNQSNPMQAMKNSWDLTREYAWVLLGGYVVITVMFFWPFFLLMLFFSEALESNWMLGTLLSIIYPLLAALYQVFAFRVYEFAKSQDRSGVS